MNEEAVVLAESGAKSEADNVVKLLAFFGVLSRRVTLQEFVTQLGAGPQKLRVLASSDIFLQWIDQLEGRQDLDRFWRERVHSAFVYAGSEPQSFTQLARRITGGQAATTPRLERPHGGDWVVTDQCAEFCGVMGGVRLSGGSGAAQVGLAWDEATTNIEKLISTKDLAALARTHFRSVPVLLSTCAQILDVESELADRAFDIRDSFFSAVPVVLYVKWALASTCWNAPEISACVVIDDPLLKPRYGFLDFQQLLDLMVRHRFSSSIAFIPWNWRRSAARVVRLFKQNPEQYSLSIHGCDHTAGEFGTCDAGVLARKSKQAAERMLRHQAVTAIRHDQVMVFPQGVFSSTAMDVLKRTGYRAAVNTEVVSADSSSPSIRIADVWDVAVMRYSNFPIFTRRYPSQDIENFAFDILLGKPCLIVIHHDFCRDRCSHLVEFIQRLNALRCQLSWRSLGEVVRHSYRLRDRSPDEVEVEMYAAELCLHNRSDRRRRFLVRRREVDHSVIEGIYASQASVPWRSDGSHVGFELDLEPDQSVTIEVKFQERPATSEGREGMSYKVKTMLRRYLSEFRDNYVVTAKARLTGISRL